MLYANLLHLQIMVACPMLDTSSTRRLLYIKFHDLSKLAKLLVMVMEYNLVNQRCHYGNVVYVVLQYVRYDTLFSYSS